MVNELSPIFRIVTLRLLGKFEMAGGPQGSRVMVSKSLTVKDY